MRGRTYPMQELPSNTAPVAHDVGRPVLACFRHNPGLIYSGDAVCEQVGVGLIDRSVPVVGDQDSLAANAVIGDQMVEFIRVCYPAAGFFSGLMGEQIQNPRETGKCQSPGFVLPVDEAPVEAVRQWQLFKQCLLKLVKRLKIKLI